MAGSVIKIEIEIPEVPVRVSRKVKKSAAKKKAKKSVKKKSKKPTAKKKPRR